MASHWRVERAFTSTGGDADEIQAFRRPGGRQLTHEWTRSVVLVMAVVVLGACVVLYEVNAGTPGVVACNQTQAALPEHTDLVGGGVDHPITSFQFTEAVDQKTFLARLPASAAVVTLVTRTALTDGGVDSDDAVVGEGDTVTDALALLNRGARDSQAALMESLRDDLAELPAGATTARAYVQRQLTAAQSLGVTLARDGGPRIKSFAVAPDPAAEAAVRQAFDGMLTPVPGDSPTIPANCD